MHGQEGGFDVERWRVAETSAETWRDAAEIMAETWEEAAEIMTEILREAAET